MTRPKRELQVQVGDVRLDEVERAAAGHGLRPGPCVAGPREHVAIDVDSGDRVAGGGQRHRDAAAAHGQLEDRTVG